MWILNDFRSPYKRASILIFHKNHENPNSKFDRKSLKFETKFWNLIQVYYSTKRCQYEIYIRGTDSNFKRVCRNFTPMYPGMEIDVDSTEQIRD